MGITLYSTLYKVTDDDLKILHETAKFLQKIYTKLDDYDSVIFSYRKVLENEAKR